VIRLAPKDVHWEGALLARAGRFLAPVGRAIPWLMLMAWCVFAVVAVQARGLFSVVGFDFGVIWAAARSFTEQPAAAYDPQALAAHIQLLRSLTDGASAGSPIVLPAPYPPVFFAVMAPLTSLAPSWSFAVWSALNLGLVIGIVWSLSARFSAPRWQVTATTLAFFLPVVHSLLLGQTAILLLAAFYCAYRSLEHGHDLRAGLWAGVLLIKPQYAIPLVVVLTIKRRWSALAGVAVIGMLLALSSLALVGGESVGEYVSALRSVSGFRAVEPGIYPEYMISWRGVLVNVLPSVSEAEGLALTFALSLATVGLLPCIWRGAWEPRSARFPAQMLATGVVAMLSAFHNHVYGATLLLVPGMALAAATSSAPRALHWLMRVGLYAPPLLFFLTGSMTAVALAYVAVFVAGLGVVVTPELASIALTVAGQVSGSTARRSTST
jgi:Glycosyltransferase family 87